MTTLLAQQEPFNLGLEPSHASRFRNVRSGLRGISVISLGRGTKLYRFNTAGRSPGGWWSTHDVLVAIQTMARATGHSEAYQGRHASAVLSDWNKCNELLCATVTHACMAFTGVGVPQTEVVPFTNMRIIYDKCRQIPQLYIPNHHFLHPSIKNEHLFSFSRIKTFADHESSPTVGVHKSLGEVEREIAASTRGKGELSQPLKEELRAIEQRLPTASGQARINLERRKREILAALSALNS